MSFITLILAAGEGSRMKSAKAKVAHEILGKPLLRWVADAAVAAGSSQIVTVVGHKKEQVIKIVPDSKIAVQDEQKGTGHAVICARDALLASAKTGNATPHSLVVLCGDTPLITKEAIENLVAAQQKDNAAMSMLTHIVDDPTNYGRVLRNDAGEVYRIVEEKDATPKIRAIKECNSGAYCFDLQILLDSLDSLNCDNAQCEYYLTDVVKFCASHKLAVKALVVDVEQTHGINNRLQLAQATKVMQRRINNAHMLAGVSLMDPDMVWIGPDVEIAADVEILPLTIITGKSRIGTGTVIGPNTRITNTTIGTDCKIDESVVLESCIHNKVTVGPRAYLRPGSKLMDGSKAGTHVEIKNSVIGQNSKVPHLSYIGDATLGSGVNIGAGSITCNYDGLAKSATTIGDNSFVGSDTMLVAPVNIGCDVTVGAGSTITKDVPDGALAVERADQVTIEEWTYKKRRS